MMLKISIDIREEETKCIQETSCNIRTAQVVVDRTAFYNDEAKSVQQTVSELHIEHAIQS